jgi:hypothetical protein
MTQEFNIKTDTNKLQPLSVNISTAGAVSGKHRGNFTCVRNSAGNYTVTLTAGAHEPLIPIVTTTTASTAVNLSTTLATSFIVLTKESATTQASLALNGITFYAKPMGKRGNTLSIAITAGATAGSEVVTCSADGVISIQVATGVSTATQVYTALLGTGAGATAARNFIVAGVTTGATTWATASAATLAGGVDAGDAKDADLQCLVLASL